MSALTPCVCRCGCSDAGGAGTHRIIGALAVDDLDAAIDVGLLGNDSCACCTPDCQRMLLDARNTRRFALAARERFRAREARLARRQQERLARREAALTPSGLASQSLPPAAAAALDRARAKAAGTPDS